MKRLSSLKILLISVLCASLITSAALVLINASTPAVVLHHDATYYLPGQNNNCLWILRLDSDVRDLLGDSSEIRIGIPEAEKRGYLGGRIEVGESHTLILAFNPPQAPASRAPIILTAAYGDSQLPIKHVRFRWNQSSLVTVVMFRNRLECLASRAMK